MSKMDVPLIKDQKSIPPSSKRTRTSAPKTRTGCHTCKTRRLKCDENKPICIRCLTSKRVCRGYGLDLSSTTFARNYNNLGVCRHPNDLPQTTTTERIHLHYFRTQTSSQLPGIFPSGFWNRLVPQYAHGDDAILHLSIALGALHQKSCQEGMTIPSQNISNKLLHFALVEYHKSVSILQKLLMSAKTRQQREICLIACVMLICFEILRGHYGTAMVHLKSGRGVLIDYLTESLISTDTLVLTGSNVSNSIEDELTEIFARLDIQGANFGSVTPQLKLRTSKFGDAIQIPAAFSSVRECRTYFDILTNVIERFLAGQPSPLKSATSTAVSECEGLLHLLSQWSQAADMYINTNSNPADDQMSLILKINAQYLHFKLKTCFTAQQSELIYDAYTPIFESILQNAEACLRTGLPLPSVSLDIGIIQPVYVTAIKCRNRQVRRRALSLLWRNPHREGMWDATLMAMVAAKTIQLEETDIPATSPIPEHNRFEGVYIIIKGEGDQGGTLICIQRKEHAVKPGVDYPGVPKDKVVTLHDLEFDNGALVRAVLGT